VRRPAVYLTLCVAIALSTAPAISYPPNLLSAKSGAGITTQAKLQANADPNALLSDGPISKGRIRFAAIDQQRTFTADLGIQREFNRIEIGTGGQPPKITIAVATAGPAGPYKTVCEIEDPGFLQTLRFPSTKARYVKFDFGKAPNACIVHNVRLYKGYEHPALAEVTNLLHARIKPNLPGLEKFYKAADQADWPNACSELRAYFASVKKPQGPPSGAYDLSRAQGFVDGALNFAGLARTDTLPIDWAYMKTTDWYEHKNFLNRGSPLGVPVDAYYHTADTKWSDFFRNIFYDWLDANPKPTVMSRADYPTWRTLDSAARLGWIVSRFAKATAGKDIPDELWANYLYSIWEHADYLKNDDFSGGNWLATITASVMNVAREFPQFSDRPKWLAFGKTGFERNVLRDIHPDGKEMEDAPGYICMAYKGMFNTLQALDAEGVAVDETVRQRMDKALDFIGAVTQPNGRMPAIGDWGGGPPWGIASAIDYFKRNDLRYILTKGAEGTKPPAASVNFPQGQWSIMRSPYEEKPYENARHLVFKSSSGSHGHRDVLAITAYAFGRELIIDPGIRSYEHADIQRYLHTAYHNTVCIDAQTQPRTPGKTEKWISNPTFDYASATYSGYKGLTHRRSVLFVKPRYWIVHDQIQGAGSHTYDQNWHFAPDANITVQPDAKTIRTNYPEGGNILIVPADTENLDAAPFDFFVATKRFSDSDGNTKSKAARYRRQGPTPATFNTILYPYAGAQPPTVTVKKTETDRNSATCLQVRIADRTDYICIPNDNSTSVSVRTENSNTQTKKAQQPEEAPWKCHIIDDTSRGADGAKLADVNADGLMDITTGWEEGGLTRAYLNPGPAKAKEKWPFVTTGKTPSAEDAVFVDLDQDGAVDVVSSCEGSSQSMFVQWAPKEKNDYLDESKWKSEVIPVSKNLTRWMFCIPMNVDRKYGPDLIAGSKSPNAQIGWFETPKNARNLEDYKWHTISEAGWIMSLRAEDMDGDKDLDILASDRKGDMRGCRWLENPGPGNAQKKPWTNHFIACQDKEPMFLTIADIDDDGLNDVLAAVKSSKQSQIIIMRRLDPTGDAWKEYVIPYPPQTGSAKAVVVADIDKNGKNDIVFSCEGANAPKSGVMWLSCAKTPFDAQWRAHHISGPKGIKYDRMELLDADRDGDLDIITCEERQNKNGLGLFWYENPISEPKSD